MKKPVEFQILSSTIKVKNNCEMSEHGEYCHDTLTIRIRKDAHEATFWHEVTHCILDHLGYEDLSKNEQFVDQFGQCLRQLEKTLKKR